MQDTLQADQLEKKFKPLVYHVVVRRLARIKRRIFREKIARWMGDLAEIVEDVFDSVSQRLNSFRLLPAFLALWLAPRHFFQATASKPTRAPLFICHAGVLPHPSDGLNGCDPFFRHPRVPATAELGSSFKHYIPAWLTQAIAEERLAGFLLLIFCFATPLWIVPLSAVMFGVRQFIRWALGNDSDLQSTSELSKPTHDDPVFLVPLSRHAYDLLDWKRYIWALCYFGLFGFLMLHLVGGVAFVSYSAAKYWMFSELHKYVPVKVLVLLLVMPVLFAETLIVRPYAEALRSARKIPTKEMHLVDCEEVRFAVSLLIAELADLARLNGSLADFGKDRYPATSKKKAKIEREREKRLVEISKTTRDLLLGWSNLRGLWRMQEFDLRDASPALQEVFFAQRSEIFSQTVELDKLQDMVTRANLDPVDASRIACVNRELRARLASSQ